MAVRASFPRCNYSNESYWQAYYLLSVLFCGAVYYTVKITWVLTLESVRLRNSKCIQDKALMMLWFRYSPDFLQYFEIIVSIFYKAAIRLESAYVA